MSVTSRGDTAVREAQREFEIEGPGGQAEQRLIGLDTRLQYNPYEPYFGQWVLVMGVRQHWRGRLIGVADGRYQAKFLFSHLYDLDDFDQDKPNDQEQPLPASEETPAIIMEAGVLSITLQPPAWPTVTKVPGQKTKAA